MGAHCARSIESDNRRKSADSLRVFAHSNHRIERATTHCVPAIVNLQPLLARPSFVLLNSEVGEA